MSALKKLRHATKRTRGKVFIRYDGNEFPSVEDFGKATGAQMREIKRELDLSDSFTLPVPRHIAARHDYAVHRDPGAEAV